MRHDIHGHMAEIEVFQLHIADIVGVWNLNIVLIILPYRFAGVRVGIAVAAGTGLGSVSGLGCDCLREDILLFKQHTEHIAHLVT